MIYPTPREEFEKARDEFCLYARSMDEVALWGAKWMAEKCANIAELTRSAEAADANTPLEIAEDIRTLAKQMEDGN